MMLEKKTTEFLEVLSSAEPVPGGGGASAAVGAFASALGMMVANLTVGKKKYADVEEEIQSVRSQLKVLQDKLIDLTDKDAEAIRALSAASWASEGYGGTKGRKSQNYGRRSV
ncbi:MAG: cyclodeaminase/cyclohydrolase family protein [[Clostridium] scindens]